MGQVLLDLTSGLKADLPVFVTESHVWVMPRSASEGAGWELLPFLNRSLIRSKTT
jgi:hypothetical protein